MIIIITIIIIIIMEIIIINSKDVLGDADATFQKLVGSRAKDAKGVPLIGNSKYCSHILSCNVSTREVSFANRAFSLEKDFFRVFL